jgi:hypothetical protein
MLKTNAFDYESCDVPEGLTLAQYRRRRVSPARRRRTAGLARLRALRRRGSAAA